MWIKYVNADTLDKIIESNIPKDEYDLKWSRDGMLGDSRNVNGVLRITFAIVSTINTL